MTLCSQKPTGSTCAGYIERNDSYNTLEFTDMITVPSLSLVKGYNYFDSTKIGSVIIEKNYLPILLSGTNQILSIPIDFSAGGNYFDYTFLDLNTSAKHEPFPLSDFKTCATSLLRK